ncbi:hypothetical protein ACWEO4_27780 [Streptomyces sp. NPDC004393]
MPSILTRSASQMLGRFTRGPRLPQAVQALRRRTIATGKVTLERAYER